ncbi:winged helix-turn-helix domain-containing protein [Pseudomonas sp. MYb118]|uniref:winged helix-turn-helix domain-containing protein n=1 Tax=Pseudomonas sp. MYb118 TaxID=1848720 RepID=UPI0034CF55DA
MTGCVLIVSDDAQVHQPLRSILEPHGFEIHGAGSLAQADACLAGLPVALVLLDARWPDALAVTRQWREGSSVGIMLIGDDTDRLAALECGADEYLVQPVQPRELLARARNLLRRVNPPVPMDTHLKRFAGWTLDTGRRRLKAGDGRETPLSHGEFQLLNVFMRNVGLTLSRDQLMDQLRNREWLPNDRSIDVLVGRLRRKLQDNPADPELIITIHGAGYLFTAAASLAA